MTRKKITIIAVAILIIGSLFLLLRPQKEQSGPRTTVGPVPTPNLQSNKKPTGRININFTKEAFPHLVEELDGYETSSSISGF